MLKLTADEARALALVGTLLLLGAGARLRRPEPITPPADRVDLEALRDASLQKIQERKEAGRAARARNPKKAQPNAPTRPVDINTATADELEALPGIGPALARRIIEFRETNGRFHHPDSLVLVPGVGPRLLERLRPFVSGIP